MLNNYVFFYNLSRNKLVKKIKEANKRGEQLNLRVDELAFYDALAENPTVETILGDEMLKKIAHELAENVRKTLR